EHLLGHFIEIGQSRRRGLRHHVDDAVAARLELIQEVLQPTCSRGLDVVEEQDSLFPLSKLIEDVALNGRPARGAEIVGIRVDGKDRKSPLLKQRLYRPRIAEIG